MMYVECNDRAATQSWVDTVHGLRYKDYQLISPTAKANNDMKAYEERGVLNEVATVKEFAAAMDEKGLLAWWRQKMGYTND